MDLILNSFGSSLGKEQNSFVVLCKDVKQLIPSEGLRSISISRGAQISSDAALFAIEREIDVLFVDNVGKPVGRIWSNKYGSISLIRKNQINFSFSKSAVSWIKAVQVEKIENQQALLLSLPLQDNQKQVSLQKLINKLEDYILKIKSVDGEVVSDIASSLRGWEGVASRLYFGEINTHLPKCYKFKCRSQHPAMDMFNCLLNYAYGILYGKIEGALIKAGIDPYVGVFHRDDYNRPVLVFDVIEKYRVWVDYVVIMLLVQEVLDEDAFSVKPDGSYWLEALGRRILIQSVNDYLDEQVKIKAYTRTRLSHISLYAQNLAQEFINFKMED